MDSLILYGILLQIFYYLVPCFYHNDKEECSVVPIRKFYKWWMKCKKGYDSFRTMWLSSKNLNYLLSMFRAFCVVQFVQIFKKHIWPNKLSNYQRNPLTTFWPRLCDMSSAPYDFLLWPPVLPRSIGGRSMKFRASWYLFSALLGLHLILSWMNAHNAHCLWFDKEIGKFWYETNELHLFLIKVL